MTQSNRSKELGEFLKTRRARVQPAQVGIAATARRRTPGLRREEVAQLAGIGLTWYTWLEQGRLIHVSEAVTESLSRVLLLSQEEKRHLYILANQPLPTDDPQPTLTAAPTYRHVLEHLRFCPSLITDSRFNVIAWNREASLLFGEYESMSEKERNIVWAMFTNPAYKSLFPEWEQYARHLLGSFRAVCGQFPENEQLLRLIDELTKSSDSFAKWWPLHEVENCGEKQKKLFHPSAGTLEFEVCDYITGEHGELKMIVHVPMPGTDTESKMEELLKSASAQQL